MMKYIVLLVFLLIVAGGVYVYSNYKKPQVISELHQGPVRPTDDEDYFRKTGITKPLEVEDGLV